MDIEKMREYVKLCETLNFTRTAKELFLSQSTLSKHILQVEEELGSQLILRSTHDVSLTAEGKLVLERFARIVADYDICTRDLAELRDGITGRIRVGFIYYGGMSYMREGLDRFFKSYSNVKVDFVSQQPQDTIAGLRSGELDAGLVYRAKSLSGPEFAFVPVHECKLYAFVRDRSELAERQAIVPSDLNGREVLMLESDPEYNDGIRALLDACDVRHGGEAWCPQVDEYQRSLVNSDAVFLCTGHMPHYPGDGIVMLPMEDSRCVLEVGLFARRDNMTGALAAFLGTWS